MSEKATTEPTEPRSSDIETEIASLLEKAAREYARSLGVDDPPIEIVLQVPRKPEHGDWAVNVALKLAKHLKRKPLEIAEGIVERVEANELIESPEVAPPGFINLRAASAAEEQTIEQVLAEGDAYGLKPAGTGDRILVEFVSANPTGPLHIGHGRNAVVGDTLARIYEAAGCKVEREYYYNDAGVQMNLLGESLRARYLQARGRDAEIPEGGYQGDYLADIASALGEEVGDSKLDESDTKFFTDYAAERIMATIRADLDALGIRFDTYFSETTLHAENKVADVLERLQKENRVYEKEGALWLKTTDFGDDKDRVVRKSDGNTTYLTPDIAYHEDKFKRGFDRLINVFGADHHGYVARLKAAVNATGNDAERLHCVLIQMVGVVDGKTSKKLSTRAGDFIPLGEIISELSSDIVRFFFLMRSPSSQMTFDMDLAREQSMDNPYYYIQYAHARCCSLLKKAEESDLPWQPGGDHHLKLLAAPEERAIVLKLRQLAGAIADAAARDDPMPVAAYLRELAMAFHSYFTAGNKDASLRCIQADRPDLTAARLTLIVALRQVLANGLRLLGLTPIVRL